MPLHIPPPLMIAPSVDVQVPSLRGYDGGAKPPPPHLPNRQVTRSPGGNTDPGPRWGDHERVSHLYTDTRGASLWLHLFETQVFYLRRVII